MISTKMKNKKGERAGLRSQNWNNPSMQHCMNISVHIRANLQLKDIVLFQLAAAQIYCVVSTEPLALNSNKT